MNTMQRRVLALTLGALFAAPALALDNGTFDTDLAGWSTAGDVAWRAGTAVLTTAFDASDDGGTNFNRSGTAPALAGGDLEAFAGLGATALDGPVQAYEGSAIRRSFTVSAGDVLSFDWRLLTNDGAMPDRAFVALDGVFAAAGLADATAAQAAGAALGYGAGTGWASFSHTFASSGTHTLALGVVDAGDYVGSSALQLDNVMLSPVPEADGLALALAGAGLLAAGGRRRRGR